MRTLVELFCGGRIARLTDGSETPGPASCPRHCIGSRRATVSRPRSIWFAPKQRPRMNLALKGGMERGVKAKT